jgi:transposase
VKSETYTICVRSSRTLTLGRGSRRICRAHDCLGRTLDWIYEHDPTRLFAGLALQARRHFGIKVQQTHIDTTSFAVNGAYLPAERANQRDNQANEEEQAVPIVITHGYSRDHRADRHRNGCLR